MEVAWVRRKKKRALESCPFEEGSVSWRWDRFGREVEAASDNVLR